MGLFGSGTDRGVGRALSQLADGVGVLVAEHLRLARLELKDDVRAYGVLVAKVLVFVPFLLVGYLFLCLALTLLLSLWLPAVGAAAVVGGCNLLAGGVGLWRVGLGFSQRTVMRQTVAELKTSAQLLSSTPQPQLEAPRG